MQLWHGSPIKKIGLDIYEKRSFQYMKNKIRFKSIDKYKLCLSPSKIFDDIFQKAFHLTKENIFRARYPRTNTLLDSSKKSTIRKKLNINSKYLIIYLPTHRNEGKVYNQETHPVVKKVLELITNNNLLKEKDITILVKPHYYETEVFTSLKSSSNVKLICDMQEYDIYDYLAVSDGLISDYSSVVFDFELTGKPIMFFPFDIDEYIKNDRSMYFDFDFVFANINNSLKVETVEDLIKKLIYLKDDNYNSSIFNEHIEKDSILELVNYIKKQVR